MAKSKPPLVLASLRNPDRPAVVVRQTNLAVGATPVGSSVQLLAREPETGGVLHHWDARRPVRCLSSHLAVHHTSLRSRSCIQHVFGRIGQEVAKNCATRRLP